MKKIVNFLFEASALKRFLRTGWQIMGVPSENIAEHVWHATVIGYVLAYLAKANVERVIKMLLFHDMPEVRTGDISKHQSFYITKNEEKAVMDQSKGLPFAQEYQDLIKEYHQRKTKEAKLAYDADILALLFRLKEFMEIGNHEAKRWFEGNSKRLRTNLGKNLAKAIAETDSHSWWEDIKIKLRKSFEEE